MIKGVNRQVIEITETGSEYFEKMLLVVKPQYSSMNVKNLKRKPEALQSAFHRLLPRRLQNENALLFWPRRLN